MTRLCAAALGVAAILGSSPVFAQAPSSSSPSSSEVWFGDLAGGVAGASKVGGVIDGEAGRVHVWRQLDASLEIGWFSSVVTRARTNDATALTGFLAQTTGQAASASVKLPALFVIANGRWPIYTHAKYHPYVLAGVGFARLSPKTTFTVGGTSLSSPAQAGLTLGTDLSGHSTGAALNIGAGVTTSLPLKGWYLDAGYRFTPIFNSSDSVLASRLNVGIGRRF